MLIAKLSAKGQIVLPKNLRDQHNWQAGTCFIVEVLNDGVLLRPVKAIPETSISELYGALDYSGPRRSIKDMEQAIANEVKRRRARGRY